MKKIIIIGGVLILLGTGAYFYYKDQIDLLRESEVQPVEITADKIDLDDTRLQIKSKVTSDSALQAQITGIDVDIYINNIKVGKVEENGSFILPAKGFTYVPIKFAFSPRQIFLDLKDILSLAAKTKNATIDVRGKINAKIGILPVPIPVYYSTTVKDLL